MTGKLIAAIVGLFALSGAGHLYQIAEYRGLEADCERRVADAERAHADTRQAHQRALGQIRNAHTEALEQERERAARARQEAESHAQARDESRARAAALRSRLAQLEDRDPVGCAVPADRVQLLRQAVSGMRARRGDGSAGADAPAGDADAAVSPTTGAE